MDLSLLVANVPHSRSCQLLLAIDGYALCVPGMHIPRYKDSEYSKWCKSTGRELVKLPSKPQGRLGRPGV
jgi:hypothetical protein